MKKFLSRSIVLFACALFAGCNTKPMPLSLNVTTRASAAEIVDSRPPHKIKAKLNPPVDAGYIVGVWPGGLALALPQGKTAAELVAGVVALHMPAAKVELTRFEMNPEFGFWAHRTFFEIEAKIVGVEGQAYTVAARGENLMANLTANNFSLAVERALQEFANQLKQVAR